MTGPDSLRIAASLLVWAGLAGAVATASEDETTLFTRPGGQVVAGPDQSGDPDFDALQLTGISTLGGQSMFNFVNPRSNRSFWLTLKVSADGYTVESFDAASDTVVLGYKGRSRSLKLRDVRIAAMPVAVAPGAAPLTTPQLVRPTGMPAGPVVRTPNGAEISNPKTPQEIAQAETEARMLVSDLLEISMQERARQRALREAQAKQQPAGGAPVPTPTGH